MVKKEHFKVRHMRIDHWSRCKILVQNGRVLKEKRCSYLTRTIYIDCFNRIQNIKMVETSEINTDVEFSVLFMQSRFSGA